MEILSVQDEFLNDKQLSENSELRKNSMGITYWLKMKVCKKIKYKLIVKCIICIK